MLHIFRKISLLIFMMAITLSLPSATQQSFLYLMRLKLPPQVMQNPTISAYYKGLPLDFKKQFIMLKEPHDCCAFTVLISEEIPKPLAEKIKHSSHDATIQDLYFTKKLPFLWYDLTLQYACDAKTKKTYHFWNIEQRKSDEVPHRLPMHTIVMHFDPQLIEGLEIASDEENCPPLKNLGDATVIFLPAIKIKPVSQTQFKQALDRAQLSALDMRTFTQDMDVAIQKELDKQPVVVSMLLGRR